MNPIAAIYLIGNPASKSPELPDTFSSQAIDFVNNCLIRDPNKRASAFDLLNHDFLN